MDSFLPNLIVCIWPEIITSWRLLGGICELKQWPSGVHNTWRERVLGRNLMKRRLFSRFDGEGGFILDLQVLWEEILLLCCLLSSFRNVRTLDNGWKTCWRFAHKFSKWVCTWGLAQDLCTLPLLQDQPQTNYIWISRGRTWTLFLKPVFPMCSFKLRATQKARVSSSLTQKQLSWTSWLRQV